MPIEFRCPSCQSLIRTPDGSSGKQARCPRCTATVVIPSAPPAAAEPSPAAPSPGTFNPPAAPAYTPPLTQPADNPFGAQMASPSQAANAFSDSAADAQGSAPINPSATPSYGPIQRMPITPAMARQRLFVPAIGLAAATVFCLAYALLTIVVFIANPDQFMKNAPPVAQEAERMGYFFGMYSVMTVMLVAPLIVAAGTVAMFRGRGRTVALIGAATAVLPCNPCCVLGLPFGIWALIVLNQADVKAAMS